MRENVFVCWYYVSLCVCGEGGNLLLLFRFRVSLLFFLLIFIVSASDWPEMTNNVPSRT